MSSTIIDILSLSPTIILALTHDSHIIAWHYQHQSLTSDKSFKDYPYVLSDFQYKVANGAKGVALLHVRNLIIICLDKEIKIVKVQDLESFIKKHNSKNSNKFQHICKSIREQQGIQCIVPLQNHKNEPALMMDQSKQNEPDNLAHRNACALIGTKSGKILLLTNASTPTLTLICDIGTPIIKQSNDIQQNYQNQINHSSHNSRNFNEHITCMLPYRDNTLLLAGTSNGRILIVSLVAGKVLEDITQRNEIKFTGNGFGGEITALIISHGGHRFYSVHQTCVIQWSMELQRALGYYAYTKPSSVLYSQKISLDKPKLLFAGCSHFIDTVDIDKPHTHHQIETNLQFTHVMREFNGKIYLGGGNGMIQIMRLGLSEAILLRRQDPNYF